MYTGLLKLRDGLDKMKSQMFLEIILMTYSYVHGPLTAKHFPMRRTPQATGADDGQGTGRYCYRAESGSMQLYLRQEIGRVLGNVPILYIS